MSNKIISIKRAIEKKTQKKIERLTQIFGEFPQIPLEIKIKDYEIRRIEGGRIYKVALWQTDNKGNRFIKVEDGDSIIFDCLVCKNEVAYSGLSQVLVWRLKCPYCDEGYTWIKMFRKIFTSIPEEEKHG